MSNWTRNDSIRLGRVAMQLGLAPYSADLALETGARFLGHGFTSQELDDMVQWQYKQWADEEAAMQNGTATVTQARRWEARMKR